VITERHRVLQKDRFCSLNVEGEMHLQLIFRFSTSARRWYRYATLKFFLLVAFMKD
jgi:hypothetical protein